MIEYCRKESCLRKFILGYFGEETGDYCGYCGFCDSVSAKSSVSENNETGRLIYSALDELRKRLAVERNVPLFVIFTNRMLADIAAQRPKNRHELYRIKGMSRNKTENYGDMIINEIKKYTDN